MRIFKNKFLLKLIASVCLLLTLFNFGMTNKVYADGDTHILVRPIVQLITGIGDAIINIVHRITVEQKQTLVEIKGYDGWEAFWRGLAVVVVTIIAVVVVAVITYFTAGLATFVVAAIAGTTFTVTAAMVSTAVISRINCWCCCWVCCFFGIFSR